jgi:hypothetical protein
VKEGEFVKEVRVEPNAIIQVDSTSRVILYTRSKPDLLISFDMKLMRPMSRL